LPLILSASVDT